MKDKVKQFQKFSTHFKMKYKNFVKNLANFERIKIQTYHKILFCS